MEEEIRRRVEAEVQQRLGASAPAAPEAAAEPGKGATDKAASDKQDKDAKGAKAKPLLGRGPRKDKPEARAKGDKRPADPKATAAKKEKDEDPVTTRRREQERILAEEKQRIDRNMRRRTFVLYPLVTVGSVVLYLILHWLGVISWVRRMVGKDQAPVAVASEPAEHGAAVPGVVNLRPDAAVQQPGAGSGDGTEPAAPVSPPPQHLVVAQGQSRALALRGDYGGAARVFEEYLANIPPDADKALAALAALRDEYLAKAQPSPAWLALQQEAAALPADADPEALAALLAKVGAFRTANPAEAFLAQPLAQQLAMGIFDATGQFPRLPGLHDVPVPDAKPWARARLAPPAPAPEAPVMPAPAAPAPAPPPIELPEPVVPEVKPPDAAIAPPVVAPDVQPPETKPEPPAAAPAAAPADPPAAAPAPAAEPAAPPPMPAAPAEPGPPPAVLDIP